MSPIKITDTSLSHMFQILANNKVKTEELFDIFEKLDLVGFHSIELCEGSFFEISLRHLKEDPWERIKSIKSKISKTKIQVQLRGQNLDGNNYFSNDIVKYFIEKVAANGIDIVRVGDPLNDTKNLETVVKACKNEGICAQGTLYYTESPVHSLEYFKSIAKQIEEMKVDSICIKDIQGLLSPFKAYELITALKKQNTIPIHLHIPIANETALTTYVKAIEAGVDGVDSSASVLNADTSYSQLELLVNILKETKFDTKLNSDLLGEISRYYHTLMHKYTTVSELDNNMYNLKNASKQITKGMFSNLTYLLKHLNQEQHIEEVISEVLRVRMDLGYPPLAAPISQIIVVQAVLNFVTGKRYRMVTEKLKDMVSGKFGKLPGSIKSDIKKTILEGESYNPKNLNAFDIASLDVVKEQVSSNIQKDEDVLTYILFPQYAKEFFECKQEQSTACEVTDAVEEEDKIIVNSEPVKELEKKNIIKSEKNILETIMKENSMPSVLYIDG